MAVAFEHTHNLYWHGQMLMTTCVPGKVPSESQYNGVL